MGLARASPNEKIFFGSFFVIHHDVMMLSFFVSIIFPIIESLLVTAKT
jgi:hypothetical protein